MGYLSILYMKCACCGGEMTKEKESERTITLKCKDCGLSNSELKG
jgi:translation initiation factor 2 beta subunit (eIF-2beta)/eIF-5